MKKIVFYIGSNNKTHELEKDKALTILSDAYEGMTVSELVGYWKGAKEATLQVQVVTEAVDYTLLKATCKKLNSTLDQDAIMVEVLNSNTLFFDER